MGHDGVRPEELDRYPTNAVSALDNINYIYTDFVCSFEITIWEGQRLYAFWLGLPVPPRPWKLQAPGSESAPRAHNPHSEL